MTNQATKERLVDATVRLLSEQGPSGTGTAEILQEAGAQRGSLYFHFPAGKDELVRAAVRASGASTAALLEEVFSTSLSLSEQVERAFDAVAEGLLGDDFRYGCAVGASTLDLAAGSAEVRRLTTGIFTFWAELVSGHLQAGGIEEGRADALAVGFVAGLEGATMLARSLRDPEPLRATGRTLAAATRDALGLNER